MENKETWFLNNFGEPINVDPEKAHIAIERGFKPIIPSAKDVEKYQHKLALAKRKELKQQGEDTDPGAFDKTGAFFQGIGEKFGALVDTGIAAGAAVTAGVAKTAEVGYDAVKGVGEHLGKVFADEEAADPAQQSQNPQFDLAQPSEELQPEQEQSFSSKAWDVAKDYWNNPKIEQAATDYLKPNYEPTFTEQANTMDNYHQAGKLVGSLPEMAVGGRILRSAGAAINVIGKGGKVTEKVTKGIDFLNKFLTIKPTPKTLTAISTGAIVSEKFQNKTEQKMDNSFDGYKAKYPDPETDKLTGKPEFGENLLRSIVGFMVGDVTVNLGTHAGAHAAKTLNKLGMRTEEALEYLNTDNKNKFSRYVNELVNEDIKDINKEITNINNKAEIKAENASLKTLNPVEGLYDMIIRGGNTELDTTFLEKINPELLNPNLPKAELLKLIENDKNLLNTFSIFKDNKRAYDVAKYFPSYIYTKEILPSMDEAALARVKKTIGDRILDLNPHDPQSVVSFQAEKLKLNTKKYIDKIKEEHEFLHNWYKDILEVDLEGKLISIRFSNERKEAMAKLASRFEPFSTKSTDLGKVYEITKNLAKEMAYEGKASPIAFLNERSVINQLANDKTIKINKQHKTLLNEVIKEIDMVLFENVEIGKLPKEFLSRFNLSKKFDNETYYANIKNEVISSILSGEKPRYIFDQMNSPEGYLRVKEALTGEFSEITKTQTLKPFKPYHKSVEDSDHEYFKYAAGYGYTAKHKKGQIESNPYKPLGSTELKIIEKYIHNKQAYLGKEDLKKSQEIFKTLETLKVQDLILEDMVKGQKLDYNNLIINLKGLKYQSVLEHILGKKISSELRSNVKPILEKLRDIDKNSSDYHTILRRSSPADTHVGVTKSGNFSFSSSMLATGTGALGYAAGGPIGGAVAFAGGHLLQNKPRCSRWR